MQFFQHLQRALRAGARVGSSATIGRPSFDFGRFAAAVEANTAQLQMAADRFVAPS